MRRFSLIGCAVLVAGGGLGVAGQGPALANGSAADWVQAQPAQSPPSEPRFDTATSAYDDATGQLVLVGESAGTWTWDGVTWTHRSPATSPPDRFAPNLAYDGATRQLVLFGGYSWLGLGSPFGDLSDTWLWNGVTWTPQHPVHSPPHTGCMAYDEDSAQLVTLISDDEPNDLSSTWLWSGNDWLQQPRAVQPPSSTCSMTYDPDLGQVIALISPPTAPLAEQVWSWNGQTWNELQSATPWVPGAVAQIAYDRDAHELVAFQVVLTSPPPYIWPTEAVQEWVMTGQSWSQMPLTVVPPNPGPVSYDNATHQLLRFDETASTFGTWISAPSAASSSISPVRLAGANRNATAAAISQAAFPDAGSAGAVVLARSDGFADALSGGPLAAAKHGPLLLTSSDSLDAVTGAEIRRVLPVGGTVYVLGSTSALSANVSAAITALGEVSVRLGGVDRFGTAIAVASTLGNPSTVFEVSGLDFPDALSAVPAAVTTGGVILLTGGAEQAKATATYLAAHPGPHYAVGGAAAAADPSAIALAGVDRYATSDQVAAAFFPDTKGITAASGLGFADALAVGPVAGSAAQPLLLVPTSGPLPEPINAYLATRNAEVTSITVVGGTPSVTDGVEQQIAVGLH